MQRRKTDRLQSRFGPEYVRAVEEDAGGQRQAEASFRPAPPASGIRLRQLTPKTNITSSRLGGRCRRNFVDESTRRGPISRRSVARVMDARGYPAADFDQRWDLSVDHGDAVQNYRVARDIVQKHARGDCRD